MRFYQYIWAFLTAACLVLPSFQALGMPPPEIRVMVEEAPRVMVNGMGQPVRVVIGEGRDASEFYARSSATISASNDGLIVEDRPAGREITMLDQARRYSIGSRTYRGTLTATWLSPTKVIVVNNVPVEDYLVGLIGSEISPAWPIESIKAQAVAARTYAMNQVESSHRGNARPYDVTSTVMSQVYDGAHKEDERSRDGVLSTKGQVLLRGGAIFPAYFHSCCGGLTEHAHNVWPGEEGPPQVEDRYCARSPKLIWNFRIPAAEFASRLRASGIQTGEILGVSTESESDSPRVENFIIQDQEGVKSVKATELRRIFGYSEIKSTWFTVKMEGGEIAFDGRGYGHGAGMCQWGAKGMADEGKTYLEILKFYYPDAELTTAY